MLGTALALVVLEPVVAGQRLAAGMPLMRQMPWLAPRTQQVQAGQVLMCLWNIDEDPDAGALAVLDDAAEEAGPLAGAAFVREDQDTGWGPLLVSISRTMTRLSGTRSTT